MRQSYQTQLSDLSEIGARMCDLAVEAMRGATTALLDADLALAERVIAMDVTLDEMRTEAEEGAVSLLALQAPVASDLRTVVSALWIVADGQRMGALAIHVAKAARRRHPVPVIPDTVRPIFAEMGRAAVDLGTEAAAVLRDRDPERARAIDAKDAVMDALHGQLFTVLLSPEWTYGVPPAVDISLLGRFYERFADHAVSVGRRVVFLLTGENVGGDTTVVLTPPEL
jgi:phosphate transport system protein